MNPNDKRLDEFIKALPEEIAPSRDLWPGIERALDNPASRRRESAGRIVLGYRAGIAAVLLLAVIAGLWFSGRPGEPGNRMNVQAMSRLFEQQKHNLLVDYRQTPALTDNWQAQLEQLESAAKAIKDALQNDPDNGVLLGMLKQIYTQQLDLIQTVHQPDFQSI